MSLASALISFDALLLNNVIQMHEGLYRLVSQFRPKLMFP